MDRLKQLSDLLDTGLSEAELKEVFEACERGVQPVNVAEAVKKEKARQR